MCGPLVRGRPRGGAGGTIRDVVRIIWFGGVAGIPWRGPPRPVEVVEGEGFTWWKAVVCVAGAARALAVECAVLAIAIGGCSWRWAFGGGLVRVPRYPLLR